MLILHDMGIKTYTLNIKDWYEEALDNNLEFYDYGKDFKFVIYKGFKLISKKDHESENYYIVDTRHKDTYSQVTNKNLKTLLKYGFIRGVDMITQKRDKKRVIKYKKKIARLYTLKDMLKDNDPSYSTKFKKYNNSIHNSVGRLTYYRLRSNRLEEKISKGQ